MNKIIVVVLILLLGIGIYFYIMRPHSNNNQLEITPSPTTISVDSPSPASQAITFSWDNLKYINTVDWPPKVLTQSAPYSCLDAGSVQNSGGKTEERVIDGKKYCVTEEGEGAAGSVYYTYSYKTAKGNDKVEILTFSIREVQCGNYPDSQMGECQKEQSSFNIDKAIAPQLQKL